MKFLILISNLVNKNVLDFRKVGEGKNQIQQFNINFSFSNQTLI